MKRSYVIDKYLMKMDRYLSLMSQEMKKRGRQFHIHQLITYVKYAKFSELEKSEDIGQA